MKIKLKTWAKENDVTYMTAYRLVKADRFPLPVTILDTGTILVDVSSEQPVSQDKSYSLYARVSSHDQKDDLDRQMERLKSFAASRGYSVKEEVKEIGSGLNGRQDRLLKLLKGDTHLLVEHQDRLTRFGFEYISAALAPQGRNVVVMNETDSKLDLVQDFIDVVTSMCARIYGTRSAMNRAKRAIEAANK